MRRSLFLAVAFGFLVAERSLHRILSLEALGGASPGFMGSLVVFVSLFAPRKQALWACWFLGVLMDLVSGYAWGTGAPVMVVGPNALGYVLVCFFVLQLRTMVFRRRVLTMGALTAGGMILSGLVVVMMLSIRSWYPETVSPHYFAKSSALGEMIYRIVIALYSGLLAVPLGWVLLATLPWWKFEALGHRRTWR